MTSDSSERLSDRIGRKCAEKHIPIYASLELTYDCNLRCKHCYIPGNSHNELSLREIKSILSQMARMGTLILTLTGGEIFTRKDIFPILSAAKSLGFGVILMTNGTLISAENVDEIASFRPMTVEVSLYGAHPETHEQVTDVPGSYGLTIKAIKLLVNRGIRVIVKTLLMKSNVKEIREIEALARDLGSSLRIGAGIVPRKDGSLLPRRHDLSFGDMEHYMVEKGEPDSQSKFGEHSTERLFCKAGRSVCSISPAGEVSPCLLMPVILGSLREHTMADIWYQKGNEILDRLRSPRAYDSSPCSKCDLLSFCVRCPGVAYLETGEPFGPSPSACQYARWRARIYNEGGGDNLWD